MKNACVQGFPKDFLGDAVERHAIEGTLREAHSPEVPYEPGGPPLPSFV